MEAAVEAAETMERTEPTAQFERRVIGAAIVTVLASLVVGFHGAW